MSVRVVICSVNAFLRKSTSKKARRRSKRITRLSFSLNRSYHCCPVDVRVFCFKLMLPQALPTQTRTRERRIRESWALSLSSHQQKKLIKDTISCKPIYSFSCDPYILPYLSLGLTLLETLVDGTFHTQSSLVLRQCAFRGILRSNRKLIKTSFSSPSSFFLFVCILLLWPKWHTGCLWMITPSLTFLLFLIPSRLFSKTPHTGW